MRFVQALSRRIPMAAVGNLALLSTLVVLSSAHTDFPGLSAVAIGAMTLITA